jgi:site-specific DNA-methyltransferase (adenine-specific)
MTEPVIIGNATLYLADCMDFMRGLPDDAFELAIVDPQYGIGAGGTDFKNGTSKSEKSYYKDDNWDTERPPLEYFKELRRVSVNQIIWGGNYFSDLLPPFRCFISWDKTIHGNSYSDCELAWTSFDRVARYYRENIAQTNVEGRIHPTQKSIKLYEWLLNNYAKSGDKILDTHLGSGSSAIAANRLGFEFFGCEIDPDYYAAACERITNAQRQQPLFTREEAYEQEQRPFGFDVG